jgi:hypothetical protein
MGATDTPIDRTMFVIPVRALQLPSLEHEKPQKNNLSKGNKTKKKKKTNALSLSL